MEFTLFDAGVAIVIVLSAILAFSRGFVREILAIAAWVVAAIAGYMLAPRVTPLVSEIPVLSDYLDNCELGTGFAALVVFAAVLVLFSLFAPLFSSLIQRSALNAFDQGLGFLFGALRGMLLVAIGILFYTYVVGPETLPMVDDSASAKVFASAVDRIDGEITDTDSILPWFETKLDELIDRSCPAAPGGIEPAAPVAPETGTDGSTGN